MIVNCIYFNVSDTSFLFYSEMAKRIVVSTSILANIMLLIADFCQIMREAKVTIQITLPHIASG